MDHPVNDLWYGVRVEGHQHSAQGLGAESTTELVSIKIGNDVQGREFGIGVGLSCTNV